MTITTIGRRLGQAEDGSLWFFCVGCDAPHSIGVGAGPGPRWTFNGRPDAPTFTPSVLTSWTEGAEKKVCHSFVTDGRIQYLGDCTHHLAGQTVDLPEWEAAWAQW